MCSWPYPPKPVTEDVSSSVSPSRRESTSRPTTNGGQCVQADRQFFRCVTTTWPGDDEGCRGQVSNGLVHASPCWDQPLVLGLKPHGRRDLVGAPPLRGVSWKGPGACSGRPPGGRLQPRSGPGRWPSPDPRASEAEPRRASVGEHPANTSGTRCRRGGGGLDVGGPAHEVEVEPEFEVLDHRLASGVAGGRLVGPVGLEPTQPTD